MWYRIQHNTLGGWEDAPGFDEYNNLAAAVSGLAEFVQEVHTEASEGYIEQPYNIENYRIIHDGTVVAQFGG